MFIFLIFILTHIILLLYYYYYCIVLLYLHCAVSNWPWVDSFLVVHSSPSAKG
jgi:hypothetical protein